MEMRRGAGVQALVMESICDVEAFCGCLLREESVQKVLIIVKLPIQWANELNVLFE